MFQTAYGLDNVVFEPIPIIKNESLGEREYARIRPTLMKSTVNRTPFLKTVGILYGVFRIILTAACMM
jgi:hypothetical protein